VAVQFGYRQFSAVPRSISGLPGWAQAVVVLAALPGAVVVAASAILAVIGIAVIGLLAMPVYRVLRFVAGRPVAVPGIEPVAPTISIVSPEADQPPGERRQVESRVVE
jgi:hypothetical protein